MLSLNTPDTKWKEKNQLPFHISKDIFKLLSLQAERLVLMGATTGVMKLIVSGNDCIGLEGEMQKGYSLV